MTPSALTRREDHASTARPLSARAYLALALACLALVFAVYSPSLKFQFVLDDHAFTSHPKIQESGHIWDYFTSSVWAQFSGGPASFYRPVFLLWVRINFLLSGLSPWGWHLLSIAKHLLAAALLALLAWKLLRNAIAALAAATLFALHPAQTESVSWGTVPDPLMAAGVLAALLCYLQYLDRGSASGPIKPPARAKKSRKTSSAGAAERRGKWLAAAVGAYFLALLTKETAIIFPAVIFALNLYAPSGQRVPQPAQPHAMTSPENGNPWWRALRQTLPFIVITAIYFLFRLGALGNVLGAATQHLPWRVVFLSWPAILWFYLKVLLWPVKSYAFADPVLIEKFSALAVVLPLCGLACAGVVLAVSLRWADRKARRELAQQDALGVERALIIGVLLLLLPLLPALNLNALDPGDFLHGRYTYLPLAGLMLLLAAGWRVARRSQLGLLCPACALVIAFAALTLAQEQMWRDDTTVFTIAHQLAPNNAPVARHLADTHVQAALQLGEQGRCSQALPVFEGVLRDFPDDWFAWAGLGDCYVQLNNLTKAEESLHRAAHLAQNPRVTEHWQALRAHMGLPNSAPAN